MVYLWIDNYEMRWHGASAILASSINHFGVASQQGTWTKGAVGNMITRNLYKLVQGVEKRIRFYF